MDGFISRGLEPGEGFTVHHLLKEKFLNSRTVTSESMSFYQNHQLHEVKV